MPTLRVRRDYLAGALIMLIGTITANEGRDYQFGILRKIGPGCFPVTLGLVLVFLGTLIAASASSGANEAGEPLPRAEWRAWLAIIAGPVLFILFGGYFGLLPATFACVFVAALGDRKTTLKGAVILSVTITVFGTLLFSWGLRVSMPILKWGFR